MIRCHRNRVMHSGSPGQGSRPCPVFKAFVPAFNVTSEEQRSLRFNTMLLIKLVTDTQLTHTTLRWENKIREQDDWFRSSPGGSAALSGRRKWSRSSRCVWSQASASRLAHRICVLIWNGVETKCCWLSQRCLSAPHTFNHSLFVQFRITFRQRDHICCCV